MKGHEPYDFGINPENRVANMDLLLVTFITLENE